MEKVSESFSFGGQQLVFSHKSETNDCEMNFAVFLPPNFKNAPVLWYLSGLTCTHQNVMEKGEYRKTAADLGLVIICPDTSPRGEHVPDEKDNWQFGSGAGFYLDSTQAPYDKNYNMAARKKGQRKVEVCKKKGNHRKKIKQWKRART